MPITLRLSTFLFVFPHIFLLDSLEHSVPTARGDPSIISSISNKHPTSYVAPDKTHSATILSPMGSYTLSTLNSTYSASVNTSPPGSYLSSTTSSFSHLATDSLKILSETMSHPEATSVDMSVSSGAGFNSTTTTYSNPVVDVTTATIQPKSMNIVYSASTLLQSKVSMFPSASKQQTLSASTSPIVVSSEDVHQTSTHIHQTSSDIHRTSIDIHRTSSDIHQTSSDIHRTTIDIHRTFTIAEKITSHSPLFSAVEEFPLLSSSPETRLMSTASGSQEPTITDVASSSTTLRENKISPSPISSESASLPGVLEYTTTVLLSPSSAILKYTGSATPTASSPSVSYFESTTPSPSPIGDDPSHVTDVQRNTSVVVLLCIMSVVGGFLLLSTVMLNLCLCGKGFSKVQNVTRFCFLLSLLASFILFPFVVANFENVSCMIFSALYLLCLLSAILWLACLVVMVLAIVIKNTDFSNLPKRKWICFCLLVTWGSSALISIVTTIIRAVLDSTDSNDNTCLLTMSYGVYWALFAPLIVISVLIVFIVGSIFYLISIINKSASERMLRKKCRKSEKRNKILQRMLIFLVGILIMFDIMVIFAVLAINFLEIWLACLFAIAAIVLGLSLLVCFGLCHEDFQRVYCSDQPYEYKIDDSEGSGPISISLRAARANSNQKQIDDCENGKPCNDLVRVDPIGGSSQSICENDVPPSPTVPATKVGIREETEIVKDEDSEMSGGDKIKEGSFRLKERGQPQDNALITDV